MEIFIFLIKYVDKKLLIEYSKFQQQKHSFPSENIGKRN